MDGVPVYLASLSRRSALTGRPIATGLWMAETRERSADILRDVVGPLGDPGRERLFRMNVTLCLHRALTDAEVAALPPSFRDAPPLDVAGGPIEVLRETVPGRPSTRPCERPSRESLYPGNAQLWVPIDCGACPPCLARIEIERARAEALP